MAKRGRPREYKAERLADLFEEKIKAGRIAYGQRLPAEDIIISRYYKMFNGFSTAVLLKMRRILVERGLVEIRKGLYDGVHCQGTYVIWKGEDVET